MVMEESPDLDPSIAFYAVCHSKRDTVNEGIERIGKYSDPCKKNVNLLTSFSQIFKQKSEIHIPINRKKLMIDSGAYDFLIKNRSHFPYTPEQYFNEVRKIDDLDPNFLVSMDHICSPVVRKGDHENNLKRIRKTIKNTMELQKIIDREDPGFELVQVVQGYREDEYKYCISEMIKRGTIENGDYIGIGSLANRKKVSEIRGAVNAVHDVMEDHGLKDVRIHLFGITLNAIKDVIVAEKITSFDSLSWTFPYRFGRVKLFTGHRMIEANTHGRLVEPEFYEISLRTTLIYVDYINYLYIEKERKAWNKTFNDFYAKHCHSINRVNHTNAHDVNDVNSNHIVVFTGDQFVILDPRGVVLSKEELYNLARSSAVLFLDRWEREREKQFFNLYEDFISRDRPRIPSQAWDGLYQFIREILLSAPWVDPDGSDGQELKSFKDIIIPFVGKKIKSNSKRQGTIDFSLGHDLERPGVLSSIDTGLLSNARLKGFFYPRNEKRSGCASSFFAPENDLFASDQSPMSIPIACLKDQINAPVPQQGSSTNPGSSITFSKNKENCGDFLVG